MSKVRIILACRSDGDLFYIELYAKISPSEQQSGKLVWNQHNSSTLCLHAHDNIQRYKFTVFQILKH